MAATPWSDWQPLAGCALLTEPVLAETLDGGQAFRWNRADEIWTGQWSDCVVRLKLDSAGALAWSAPPELAGRVAERLPHYLGLNRDFPALVDALPWRSDPHLARCLADFPGLRILRQPFGETLLGFLCSATKQIVQIKQMMVLLAERHGTPIESASLAGRRPLRLPTWAELAQIPERELRECALGFRARYIADTARFLAKHPGWLEATETLPYAEAKERLCSLPGVGEKIADCVLLFGAGRLEAFPVDTWILKAVARRYDLADWKPAQVAQFGRAHFGALAGLAQQFLFAWERRAARVP
jgi:N-glycosylase/DNA lyase